MYCYFGFGFVYYGDGVVEDVFVLVDGILFYL